MREEWRLLRSFLPPNWRELAVEEGALRRHRGVTSIENLLRVLLMHLSCGYSLRETAARARRAGLAEMSDVALMKRLRQAGGWFQALCEALFQEQGLSRSSEERCEFRLVDGTTVREPGKSGSLWRIHYSVRLPTLECDFFRVTGVKGAGSGESLKQFPIRPGDRVVADRGYARAPGIVHVAAAGGEVLVRVNTRALAFETADGNSFDLLTRVRDVRSAGESQSWSAQVVAADGARVSGRVCAVRKSREAIRRAQKKLRLDARRRRKKLQPSTLEFARFVIVFTTFPEEEFSAEAVLEWYRIRWQVELVFKRFKSLAQLGHLPKYNEDSARAWLYGKLLLALLVEKVIRHGRVHFPLGIRLGEGTGAPARGVSSPSFFTRLPAPLIPRSRCLASSPEWNAISRDLAEPPRLRRLQIANFFP